MDRIQEIHKKLQQLLPTTEYKITDYQEETFKWASSYQNDVQYLLEENNRLREEIDSFQRVGIKVQNVYEELIVKMISFAGISIETKNIQETDRVKEELRLRGYELIVSHEDLGVTLLHLIHKGEKVVTGLIKNEIKLDEGLGKISYTIVNPNES